MANYVRGCCDVCVRERDRSMYQLEPVDLHVTHGEVSVPQRGPRQLWPLLPHNRVGEHQRQLLLLLWISTQAQKDKGLEQNPVSKYVLYNIGPRSCPCMCFWALYCKVRIYFETGFCVGSRDRGRSIGRLWVPTRSSVGRSNITPRTLLVSL